MRAYRYAQTRVQDAAAAALAAVATPNPIAVFKNSTITVVLKIKQRPHTGCSLLFGLSVCGWWLVMMMGGVVDSSQWETVGPVNL